MVVKKVMKILKTFSKTQRSELCRKQNKTFKLTIILTVIMRKVAVLCSLVLSERNPRRQTESVKKEAKYEQKSMASR